MLIAGSQLPGRACALVVTAAAVVVLGTASPALARTSGTEVQPADLIADASWHGRPIEKPDAAPTRVAQPVTATQVAQGSPATKTVREIQSRLHALGYRTGPVDGAFGPRTRSSVAWFQIKHRLRATGVVDGATLALLRFRTNAIRPTAAPSPVAHGDPVPRVQQLPQQQSPLPRLHSAPATPTAAPARHGHGSGGLPLPLLLAALLLALVAVAVFSTWLRGELDLSELRKRLPKRVRTKRVPARQSVPRRGRSSGAVAAHTNGNGRQVIGYAVGRDERDFARQRRAMERVCGERGWTLAALVKERESAARRRRRPGRARVLSQVAAGGVGHVIVGRLQSLANSPGELAVLLEWCRRRQVGLLALDVGLDTTTPNGRLAARCLGAVSTGAVGATGAR